MRSTTGRPSITTLRTATGAATSATKLAEAANLDFVGSGLNLT